MIRHICMFKLKEEGKEANLAEALKRVEVLRDLPQVRRFEVVTNCCEAPESNYELALVCDFNNIEGLNEYQVHPVHKNFGAYITPVRESRACIDYEY